MLPYRYSLRKAVQPQFLMLFHTIATLFTSFSVQLAWTIISILHAVLLFLANLPPQIGTIVIIAAIVAVLQMRYIGSIALIPYIIVTAFGTAEKHTTWSVVYDSKTKLPIDPAYVTVRNMQGREMANLITDLNGRFSLLLSQGLYTIEANKTNYTFPSAVLDGMQHDGEYEHLYFGSIIEVSGDTEQAITVSIPMDPINPDWNQVEKKRKKIFYRFDDQKAYMNAAKAYSVAAAVLALCHLAFYSSDTALHQLGTITVLGLLVFAYAWHKRQYVHSFVLDKHSKLPLAFARVTVYSARTKNRVSQKTTSFEGQFTCLLSKGSYYLTIERRDDKGDYVPAFTSEVFSVKDGYIGKRFAV